MENKKQNKGKKGFNPVATAITGAIVGAGIAIAGTVALESKKNREKIRQVLTDVKDQAVGYMDKIQKEVKNNVERKLPIDKKKKSVIIK